MRLSPFLCMLPMIMAPWRGDRARHACEGTVCLRASSLCSVQVHQNEEYFYIVMDLCQGNLHDLIADQVLQSSPQHAV